MSLPETMTDVKATDTNVEASDYLRLNASLNLWTEDSKGHKKVNYDADRKATRAYFLNHVNPNTQYFSSLQEKLDFLVKNGYYEKAFLDAYSPEFIKKLYQHVYSYKHRFPTFISAYKAYQSYMLRTFDGKRYLERWEDRIAAVSLYLARGNEKLAMSMATEMITGRLQTATPTFMNAGRASRGELVSCFLIDLSDDLNSIFRSVNSGAQLSKRGGGVAFNLSNLRAKGDPIKGYLGAASGVVPVMKILEDTSSYANQLGQRQGAFAVYLNALHLDIIDFLDTKRENADEKIRMKTLSIGVNIPDILIELARKGQDVYRFSPYDVSKRYGKEFSEINLTEHYQEMVDDPNIRKEKTNARAFLSTLAEIQMESGYPYILFGDAANRGNNVGGTIKMSNLCVSGDTLILTDKGYRTAKDLYNTQEDFNVVVDDRARLMDASKATVSTTASTRMFRTAENADVFELRTHEGHSIKATEWHKFYIQRGDKIVKLQMNELVPGDKLLMQPAKGSFGNVNEPALAYLAGAMAADGTFSHNTTTAGNQTVSAHMHLHGSKKVFANKFAEATANALTGRTDLLERQATLTPQFTGEGAFVSLTSAPLAKLLAENGLTAETKTSIPQFVIEGTEETQKAYIDGLFALDGTVTVTKDNVSVQLGSINHEHLTQVQRLLLNFGIYSRIYNQRVTAIQTTWPDGKTYTSQPSWSLRVSTSEAVEQLLPMIQWKPEIQVKADKGMERIANKSKGHYNTHKFLATVKDMTLVGQEDVYDVTVEDGHSLIFNGFSTGNCTEILQPQYPSVINDKQEYETLGEDISCNLASLNVYNAIQSPDFGKTIETSIRALYAVSDLSNIDAVPTVANGNKKNNSVGLGAMNLHGTFAHYHMYYGDEESLDLTNTYFHLVTYHAIRTNMLLAKETGSTFAHYQGSKYQTGEYFEKFTNPVNPEWLKPQTAKVKKIFKDIHIPTTEDWATLAKQVKKYGLKLSHVQCIPPTGSISQVSYSTPSIHPVATPGGLVETRTEGKLGSVYAPTPHGEGNEDYFRGRLDENGKPIPGTATDMYSIDSKKVIDVYSVAQYYIDQGMSLTLGVTSTETTKSVVQNILYAYSKDKPSHKEPDARAKILAKFPSASVKTLYYVRVLNLSLDALNASNECVSCAL